MVIKITPKFNQVQIKKFIEDKIGRINQAVLSRLQQVGETFVNNARNTNTYKDVTANLRSSIGYLILKDGIQIGENFKAVRKGKNGDLIHSRAKKDGTTTGEDGVKQAESVASKIADEYPNGYVLICVAGMDYAASVESRGKDVITGSSKLATEQLERAIESLQKKIS